MQRGIGTRCMGFLSSDGKYAHCSREEYSGGLPTDSTGDAYAHRLNGTCKCGTTHGPDTEARPLLLDISELRNKQTKQPTQQTPPMEYKTRNKTEEKNNSNPTPPAPVETAAWDYLDEHGALSFQVVRRDYEDGRKEYKQRRPNGKGGWAWDRGETKPLLYRLPEILALSKDQPLVIVEGEKAADACWENGIPATTNPGGAGKWHESFNDTLRDRKLIILPDNDPEFDEHGKAHHKGQLHAAAVFESLKKVASVKVVELPGLPDKGDAYEWFNVLGKTNRELVEVCNAVRYSYPPKFFYDISELNQLPPVEWLLDNIFQTNSLSMSAGESGIGKTFVIVNFGMRIAAEQSKLVIYVASEAVSQYKNRIEAWIQYNQINPEGYFKLSTFPLRLMEQETVVEFINMIKASGWQPALIVIDTLHAAAEGSEENSAKDTGIILSNLRLIRDCFKANVHVVHHLGKNGMSERGSGALKAGMETSITIKANGDGIKVECEKQRSAAQFETYFYNWYYPENSLSRVPQSTMSGGTLDVDRLNNSDKQLLQELGKQINLKEGLRFSELLDALAMHKSSLNYAIKKCSKCGWIQGGGTRPYIITNDGLTKIGFQAASMDEWSSL